MDIYGSLSELSLTLERITFSGLSRPTQVQQRRTTVIELHGADQTGVGEDVTYQPDLHSPLQELGSSLELTGEWTLQSFSSHIAGLDLFFGTPPDFEVYRQYRLWGFESAALDLALRQAGVSLAQFIGRTPEPTNFVASPRLEDPPSFVAIERRLEAYPDLRFKLDATPTWTQEMLDQLAAIGRVDVIDFKGMYRGTPVDVQTDPDLYRRVQRTLTGSILEDPDLSVQGAQAALESAHDRISWDAPIHSVDDIESLPFEPKVLNMKPSRFGSLEALFSTYHFCGQRGIRMYGGGQAELGPGRGQIQYLASLFHADAPNDVAPIGFDWAEPPAGLPQSPLPPDIEPTGFRRRTHSSRKDP